MKTSFIKFLLPLVFSIFNFQFLKAQLYIEDEILKVEKNAIVKVEGNLVTKKSGSVAPKIRNWGTIAVTGNTDFDATTDYKGQGDLCLLGSSQQTISTNGIPLKKLDIQNSNNVELSDALTLQGELKLTSGFLLLGNYNLTIDDSVTITGGSSSSYLRINGTGKVIRKGGSSVVFPIGYNPYAPVTIDCSSCGSVDFTIGVADNVYDNPVTSTGQKTTNVVDQQWNIAASSSVSNVSITLGWEQSQETTGFTRTASGIGHWENGVSSAWDAQTPTTASGSNPYSLSKTLSSMSTNTYYFGIGSNGSALPVEFTYFQAQWAEEGKTVQLNWQTAMEEDNSHFEIQRSLDGHTWEQIGKVEGAGNSMSPIDYNYTDQLETRSPKPETVFYRLKQVDFNGNYEYSHIKALSSEPETINSISIYPNPANSIVHLQSNKAIDQVQVVDLHGRTVLTSRATNQIDVGSLPQGTYVVRTQSGTDINTQKLRVN